MSVRGVIAFAFAGSAERVRSYIFAINALKRRGHRRLAHLLCRRLERRYGVFISVDADVPSSTRLPHPIGIVIGKGVRLGEGVVIYQNVTLGGRNRGDGRRGQYPVVGDGTVVFAGAVLIGGIEVGSGSVVGANAVVLSDVPSNSVAAGVPARIRAVRPASAERPSSSPTCQSEM